VTFQILALSGGGFFGYYTACVLARLEERLDTALARHFDLLAGTSVGGIIALGLSKGVPARTIREAFEEAGTRIFSDRSKPEGVVETLGDVARGAMGPKFNAPALRETIAAILGEDTRLGDLDSRVMIPAVDLGGAQAHLFTNYRDEDADLRAVDVGMATTAVPTFFPMAAIGGRLFADGGLFANAPDHIAAEEAVHRLSVSERSLRVLSVGTASMTFHFPEDAGPEMGGIEWLMNERLMRTTMAAQQSSVVTLMRQRLGDRFYRIDSVQTPAQQDVLGLHVATKRAQRLLSEMADAAVADIAGDEELARFLRHGAKTR